MRSSTSSRSSRAISGTKRPVRPYGVGRVRRPSSSTSRKPRVVIRPTRRDLALEHRVGGGRRAVHDRVERRRVGARPRRAPRARRRPGSRPSSAPSRGARRRPPSSTRIRSVKVPPTSMPAIRLMNRPASYAEVGALHRFVLHQRVHRAGDSGPGLSRSRTRGRTRGARSAGSAPTAASTGPRASARRSSAPSARRSPAPRPPTARRAGPAYGLPISVRAIVSICCSPPLIRPPGRSGISARFGNSANSCSGVQARRAVARAGWRPTSRFSSTVRSVKMRRSSGT